jgi:hypothetical protein
MAYSGIDVVPRKGKRPAIGWYDDWGLVVRGKRPMILGQPLDCSFITKDDGSLVVEFLLMKPGQALPSLCMREEKDG